MENEYLQKWRRPECEETRHFTCKNCSTDLNIAEIRQDHSRQSIILCPDCFGVLKKEVELSKWHEDVHNMD